MASKPHEFIEFKEETYTDYVSRYDIELNRFLSDFEDNTEALFIDYQISNFTYHKNELLEFIKNIDFNSESRNEYLDFLKNRVLFSNIEIEIENDLCESEEHAEYLFYYNFLVNRRASVSKILEFLEGRKELISNSSEASSLYKSSEKVKDNTKMPWFIVGLNFANGEIQKLVAKDIANGKITEGLGLKYSDGAYISKSKLFIPCKGEKSRNNVFNYPEKITEIYNYCINNGINVIPEFEEIALKYI